MKTVIITKNDEGQRLDKFLSKYLKTLPQALLYRYIRLKRVKVNGKKSDISARLKEGDVLTLYINDSFFETQSDPLDFTRITPSLQIVYEDENILLVDKKPGIIVHEDDKETYNTLMNHIKAYLYAKKEYDPATEHSFAPALCNRIDRNTGGIVIAAKNAQSLRVLNQKIKDKEIRKFYLCLATGIFSQKEGTVSNFLKKDPQTNTVKVCKTREPGALSAVTKYRVLREKEGLSLVEVELITGRTHQIRATLASLGHPLAGDGKYGSNAINKKLGRRYQALYSYKLRFDFTTDGDILSYLNGKTFCVKSVDFADDF